MLTNLRLKHGLHWVGKYPSVPWVYVAACAACIAALLGAIYVDRINDRLAELERAEPFAQTLFDCMSGATGFYFKDTTEVFACDVYSLGKSNLRRNTKQDS
jgi:hypothetical protein